MPSARKDKCPNIRAHNAKTKAHNPLHTIISDTIKLWRRAHLTYDQTRYVAKAARRALALTAPATRAHVVARLSREEERRLIAQAYRMPGVRGLLIKTLCQTGARVSEFVNIQAKEVYCDEQMLLLVEQIQKFLGRWPALPSQRQRNLFSAWAMLKLGAPPLPDHPALAARPPRMMTALDDWGACDHPPSYLTSVTSISDTANRKSTPWPTPVRLMTTPLSFCMVVAAAPPPTTMPAVALTYFPSKSATFFK
jgi:hypothetical protein